MDDLKTEFQEISERASVLVGRMDPSLFGKRPKPESWSAAECLAHLNVSADAYFPIWKDALGGLATGNEASSGFYRMDFWGHILF
jgi:hypothetical protein